MIRLPLKSEMRQLSASRTLAARFRDIQPSLLLFLHRLRSITVCNQVCMQLFLHPEDGSQKATLVVLVVVIISSLKIPEAFLIRSGAQRNFAYVFMLTLPTDLPSQVFKLIYN